MPKRIPKNPESGLPGPEDNLPGPESGLPALDEKLEQDPRVLEKKLADSVYPGMSMSPRQMYYWCDSLLNLYGLPDQRSHIRLLEVLVVQNPVFLEKIDGLKKSFDSAKASGKQEDLVAVKLALELMLQDLLD